MTTISDYFATLQDWKRLPAYRAETRIDSIVGFALPQVLLHARGLTVKAVVPELPLRFGSIRPPLNAKRKVANLSFKVDFFVVTECGKNLLIEFKTDSASRRDGQDAYLRDAQAVGLNAVLSGVLVLYAKTKAKTKYRYLIEKLMKAGLVRERGASFEATAATDDIDIIYIQPRVKNLDIASQVIDFNTVAESLRTGFPDDEFMLEASKAFEAWAAD